MDIKRLNSYSDARFSDLALRQHGCYLVDGLPCEVLILSQDTACITGASDNALPALIDAFRFHAPHITRFVDGEGRLLRRFPPRETLTISLDDIQPSQFYVDEEKLAAVSSFIHRPEDIIIQVLPHEGRYIALDGHTRLYLASQRGWASVRALTETADDYIFAFAAEAARRGIRTPADMSLVSHEEYKVKWHQYCDDYFQRHR
ncbi:MAG: hypothetical protein ACI4ME_12220 [Aristaeellaceae bacterium]